MPALPAAGCGLESRRREDFPAYLREILALRPPAGGRGPENLVVVERVESTNLLARAVAADYHRECQSVPEALFLAYEQTGGRGRLGRSWSSPAGKGVYATLSRPVDRGNRGDRGAGRRRSPPCRSWWASASAAGSPRTCRSPAGSSGRTT